MKFTCDYCGKEHEGLLMNPAYKKPLQYLSTPERERKERIQSNDDFIVIDNEITILRGNITIPVIDSEEDFVWTSWAIIDPKNAQIVLDLWDEDASNHPPFDGILDIFPKGYERIEGSKISVQLQNKKTLPIFNLLDKNLLMYKEQKEGINLKRVHEILEVAMPWLFENA